MREDPNKIKLSHELSLKKLESEKRITMLKIELESKERIAHAEASTKASEANAFNSSLALRMLDMMNKLDQQISNQKSAQSNTSVNPTNFPNFLDRSSL